MRKFKARSGGVGAGEEVADTAQTDAEPSGHVPPGALTVLVGVHHPETAITCGGSQRQLRAGRLPLRLYRGACQRQPLSEHPEARPRPPSPCPTVAPGGTWRRHVPGGPPGLCHLARGASISWATTIFRGGRTMSRLEGKVALVTGASKGIGAGIAKGLAAAGASVAVNYASDRGGAEAVVAAITASGGRAIVVPGDVSKSADVARLFVQTKAAYGALDVLVNNAAVYKFGPLEATTEEEFHREFNTNVLGPLLMIREAVKYFGPRGGSIINIGSMASQLTPPNLSIYTATKGALDAITRVLAKELGPRQIRVNSINPGATATEGARAAGVIGVGSDFEKQMIAMTPLGRIGQPSDIAPIAVFLASDESGWLTGEIILASGGQR